MRRTLARTLAAALVAVPVLTAAAPVARAGTCPLLVDVWGDGTVQAGGAVVTTSDDLDIRSADLASGTNDVVVTLRLATLSPSPVGRAPVRWAVGWHLGSGKYGVSANRDADGAYSGFAANANGQHAVLTVDVAHASLTWTVPRSAFSPLATPGATFDSITAASQVGGTSLLTADQAATTQTYVDQTAGCIPAS
jgi:hypothetical protein